MASAFTDFVDVTSVAQVGMEAATAVYDVASDAYDAVSGTASDVADALSCLFSCDDDEDSGPPPPANYTLMLADALRGLNTAQTR